MPYSIALRTLLITSLALLACNSIAYGQNYVTATTKSQLETSTDVVSTETKEARPGERVSNPAHSILNSDTTLGGVAVNGPNPTDHGYLGPGDMRTHLWNGHSQELIANGLTENKVMAMSVEEAQKWHNHFHGAEGSPEHADGDQEQNHFTVVVPEPAMPEYSAYVQAPVYGSTVYENPVIDNSGFSQPAYSQPEIIYGQGVIIGGATSYGYPTDFIGQ